MGRMVAGLVVFMSATATDQSFLGLQTAENWFHLTANWRCLWRWAVPRPAGDLLLNCFTYLHHTDVVLESGNSSFLCIASKASGVNQRNRHLGYL